MNLLHWFAEIKWSWFHVKQWRAFVACYKAVAITYDIEILNKEQAWVKQWIAKTFNEKRKNTEEWNMWQSTLSWINAKAAWLSNDWSSASVHIENALKQHEYAPKHLQGWLAPHVHAWCAIVWLTKLGGQSEIRHKIKKVALVRAHDAIWGAKQYPSRWFSNDKVLLTTTVLKTCKHPEIDERYWRAIRGEASHGLSGMPVHECASQTSM